MAFKAYDKEGKGEIPSSMLGTVMKNLGHNLKPDQLQEAIEAVDADGSGWIDFDLKVIFKTLDPDMSDDEVENIIDDVDEDGSGTVDFEGNFRVTNKIK